MVNNFHTHTFRCHHAEGEDEEYVLCAIENGFKTLGFSDHCAWHFDLNYKSGMRMSEEEIIDYVSSVKALKKKYAGVIDIKLGWEVEYFEKYWPWMTNVLKKYKFDYIILGHHFCGDEEYGDYNGNISEKKQIVQYGYDVCEGMRTSMFSYVAHPDLFFAGYQKFDETAEEVSKNIISQAIAMNIPLEFNLLGYERNIINNREFYPYPKFWELAGKMGAKAILGLDAHSPQKFSYKSLMESGKRILKMYDVELVDTIKYFNWDY